ncbi:MAG TPA: cytochrome c [Pyrinomonadaceae bacterium]|nr:cytochrome c [Pyrinomonadaceae bacterium]
MRSFKLLLFIACVFGLAGHAERARAGHKAHGRRQVQTAARAESLFRQSCARCHGLDGRARTELGELTGAPDFADAAWQEGRSGQRMRASIAHGRGGMPSFKDRLSPGEIASLVAYIRGFQKVADQNPRR